MRDFATDLNAPLLKLTSKDSFTLGDACNGVHVFGAIGSGKTSGAGRALAGAYLRAGMGGLVLCAKPEEVELWRSYCQQHGREQSMIVFDESRGCNFISYEFARKGADAAGSVTDTIMRILKAADMAAGQGGGRDGEQFWINTMREMLRNTIAPLYGANGNVTVRDIVRFVTTAPTRPPASLEESKALDKNFAVDVLYRFAKSPKRPAKPDLVEAVTSYWTLQYTAMPEKTRGSITTHVTSNLNRFTTGILRESFCDKTNIVPEMCFSGAIILLAFPTLSYNEEGIVAQTLFKYLFQRAVESRNSLAPEFQERPVFLYADEAQFFVGAYDDTFLSTCRGSKCAVVYLTQSLPTYYAMLGKERSDAVDGFVGKFNSKIFHLNADPRTNAYASSLIGRGVQIRRSVNEQHGTSTQRNKSHTSNESITHTLGDSTSWGSQNNSSGFFFPTNLSRSTSDGGGNSWSMSTQRGGNYTEGTTDGENHSVTSGGNEHMDNRVESNFFSEHLRSGGAGNNYEVTGVWFKAGGKFNAPMPNAGSNVILATFKQERRR